MHVYWLKLKKIIWFSQEQQEKGWYTLTRSRGRQQVSTRTGVRSRSTNQEDARCSRSKQRGEHVDWWTFQGEKLQNETGNKTTKHRQVQCLVSSVVLQCERAAVMQKSQGYISMCVYLVQHCSTQTITYIRLCKWALNDTTAGKIR